MSPTQGERIGILEQRLNDHESRCEERLSEIKATAAGTLKAVDSLKTRVWALVLSLLAWSLAQLWTANQGRLERLEALPPPPPAVHAPR